ncbi:hypothetical protein [Parvularcula dongshanensis]|uniref:Alpha/beta hydrolase n=1 Tax=Parvularcula dongshanensis TaxID=1173995 RepID=A0A840I197_9PROT|nr:hypothetical protein [Parvularcula dongshanensis]MBB4657982.1 hypothetical protein [Parvularcula dongshanensis]
MPVFDSRDDLDAFGVPTPIVHGTAEETVRVGASGDRTAKLVRGAAYERAPHGLLATRAQRLTDDLKAFLRS